MQRSTSSRSSRPTSTPSTSRWPARPAPRACSTSTSTTCATSPTTATAPSTTAPYGGGAGMVMKPEPWGEAIDAILAEADGTADTAGRTVLVVPTPSGAPFTQAAAADLATADRLVVACGRYEGIDQRVVDHYAGAARGPRDLARRLRPQRRRGRRAGRRRGGRPPAAGLHGQRRLAGRGVPRRGRPAGVPRLHQARLLARARRTAGAAVGRPRADRGLAPRPGGTTYGAAATRPAAPQPPRRGAPRPG